VADVRFAQRSEHRVANRVHQHVRVRVPVQTFAVRNFDAPKHKLPAFDELVDIVTNADMIHGHEYRARSPATKDFCAACERALGKMVWRPPAWPSSSVCLNTHDTDGGLSATPRKPMGWLIGLGVMLITLGVVFGLVGIGIVAKRKQAYRINEAVTENGTSRPSGTNAR
jgi:hypothetical protein